MTTNISTSALAGIVLPTYEATEAEAAILAIPSLRGWFDVSNGVFQSNGFRWQNRIGTRMATVFKQHQPLVVTGSNGKPALQTSYGSANFATTERGALRMDSQWPLIGAAGFTVFSVTRVPTVASGESATLGGYVWSSRGVAGNNTPGLNISGSTGRPTFRAGGVVIGNPGGFDARTGNWHCIRCVHDMNNATLAINIDKTRATGSNTGASVAPDVTITNMLAPFFGCFLSSAGVYSSPFYGQTAALLFFDGVLTASQIVSVETYLASEFGVTLV